VTLKCLTGARADAVLEGWALNVSRGGIRVILEDKVEPGDELDITFGDTSAAPAEGPAGPVSTRTRRGCIVWVQEESDGVVAGIAFKNGGASSVPPQPASEKPAGG
jgi:hypothetical protein